MCVCVCVCFRGEGSGRKGERHCIYYMFIAKEGFVQGQFTSVGRERGGGTTVHKPDNLCITYSSSPHLGGRGAGSKMCLDIDR